MFEDAELGHTVDKTTYDRELPALRDGLLEAQFQLVKARRFPVVILMGGVEGGGRSETVNSITSWMDPRHIQVNGLGTPSDEEEERPRMWRYWRALPPAGTIGVFFGSWYTEPILAAALGKQKARWAALDERIAEINRFEKMLAEEGTLVLKYWFHLSKEAQRKRIKSFKSDPTTRWRVTKRDEHFFDRYDDFREVSEWTLRHTSKRWAPWLVLEGADRRYRELTVGAHLLAALRARLTHAETTRSVPAAPPPAPAPRRTKGTPTVLSSLDLTQRIPKAKYESELTKWQGRLAMLTREPAFQSRSVVLVFEGNDAAGKGGAIRRLANAVDARLMRLIPIAAPTDEERAHPYLWRFWRQLPRQGHLTVFDRSWYGRVLVERVEGHAAPHDWQRAYAEINDFEEEIVAHGTVLVKFWLATSKEEQLKRFKERARTSFKSFKLTPDDWRNRKRWDQYAEAVCDMVAHTSTADAPWNLVEANDKYFARIKVLKTVVRAMEEAL